MLVLFPLATPFAATSLIGLPELRRLEERYTA
jgi:hypothetical protein